GFFDRLRDQVVDGGAARPGREPAGEPVRRFGPTEPTAANLDEARPQVRQHPGERRALRVGGAPGRVAPPPPGGAGPERPRLPASGTSRCMVASSSGVASARSDAAAPIT